MTVGQHSLDCPSLVDVTRGHAEEMMTETETVGQEPLTARTKVGLTAHANLLQ